jgi:glutathione S-transferase
MNDVTVYGVPGSPYVRSALLGFEEKGAPYRLLALGLGDEKKPDHLIRHPFGRVPTINHNGFELYETQAILRYIDATFHGTALQPHDLRAAARMDQIAGVVDWYFFRDITAVISFNRFLAPLLGVPTDEAEAAIAAALPKARICVDALEQLRAGQRFLAGNEISIADLMLAPQLEIFMATSEGHALLAGRGLADWLAMMAERPSMKATTRERLQSALKAA